LNLGVDPVELVKQPLEFFFEPGLTEELEKMKIEKYEALRLQKLNRVMEERQKLENFGPFQRLWSQDAVPEADTSGHE